ncbi:nitrate- and nitrite sensing domain-containing protein [Planomonospora sp. ID67723]|uniref:sensor histidine kinase n=1 Tax=Planomonospora sp. ID67723 TaxID=2738134 RepID=UPI0018C38717|nr:nitrate- and nitrite sensing domain-containing protein [Planomonospora sp. ID67723]MBG0828474.1 nitrate- and nitrite sensing domain-containing protein [Planomonospora sp. ID67723]
MRSRLVALIAIPTAAAIVLGVLRVVTAIGTAAEYEQVRTTAELAADLSDLVHGLQLERDLSARFVAQGRPQAGRQRLKDQYDVVDKLAKSVSDRIDILVGGGDFADREREQIARMGSRITELPSMRTTATDTSLPPLPMINVYSEAIREFLVIHDEIIQGDADQELSGSASAFAALGRAKEQASQERANLAVALVGKSFTPEGLDAFIAARAQRDSELAVFRAEASLAQRQFYDDTVTGQKIDRAEFIRLRALALAAEGAPLVRVNASGTGSGDQTVWFDASSEAVDRMRVVEKSIANTVIAQSRAFQESEQRGALIAGGLTALLLLLVLAITVVVARSLVKPLRTLRTEALSIAGSRLPETVQAMRESGEVTAKEVPPIGVVSDDEIGEVARAFDEVHREAVRLAGEEASLRSNVNAMFVNLSRRSQTLVERQLALIESLEQGEQDENRLGSLFRLDHLATRMRRNSENLLVLAGQEPARRWSQPIPLIDVVRASLSEVESYERVELRLSGGVSVAGTSVNDVVHLIAELVENAISFSPRETKVVVSSNRIDGGGVMISVTDLGIGMTGEELAQANWRLANPPVVDVSVSRRMGLFVVGRLALRHGIRVQLRQQDSGGLTAMVLLPENLLATVGGQMPGMQMPGMQPGPQSGDWGAAPSSMPSMPSASSFPSMDRPPVLTSPVSLDAARPAFSSFEAARQDFNSFDAGQGAASFQSFSGGGGFGQAPVDTPWPGHVPAPGSGPGWPNTFTEEPGPSWPTGPMRGDSGAWPDPSAVPPGSRRFASEADSTGPLPVVHDSFPLEEEREEFLPIFAAVESDWFKKAEPYEPSPAPASAPQDRSEDFRETTTVQAPVKPDAWSSPADAGWQAARAASEPTLGGLTGSGLPKRVPKANLVPGAAPSDPAGAPQAHAPRPVVSPDAVRNRLASFQRGVRQGRAVAKGEIGEDQTYPGPAWGAGTDRENR